MRVGMLVSLHSQRLVRFCCVPAALQPVFREVEAALARKDEISKAISTVMVMKDVSKPRMTYVLDRGQYDAPRKDEPVEPGVLEDILPLPEGAPANRLGLAQWLTARAHPLVARVLVNRIWQRTFGEGLVRTPADLLQDLKEKRQREVDEAVQRQKRAELEAELAEQETLIAQRRARLKNGTAKERIIAAALDIGDAEARGGGRIYHY